MPDIESILRQMTLEEKAALCTGASPWSTVPVERLGVPPMFVADGPHGVRRVRDEFSLGEESLPATCFPTASSLASTWDVTLIKDLGQALGEECLELGVNVLLGPGANMKRTPVCGRNFEYFSEDPYLAGQMAANFIQGVQSQGVGTSLKHYAANNQEYQRMSINAVVDERTLREIYLPAFETAVKQGKPWTVMCAYNRLNGSFCSEHRELLVDILKDEWGFEGLVVSDWGAVHDRVASLQGGLDLEMPGPKAQRVKVVVESVQNGALDEALLDEAVRRILQIVFKAAGSPKGKKFDKSAHHALARKIAGEGMVLLKNNGILPLKGYQKIAVIGRTAKNAHFQGGGSSHINPTQVDVPFDELQKLAGEAVLVYAEGYPDDPSFQPALIEAAVEAAKSSEVALLYIGLPTFKESEGYDRADLVLTEQQVALIKAVTAVQPKTVVVLNNGSAVTMGTWLDGAAAVLEAWMMGQAGGGAIADVLFGKVNPSGKLSETFPLRLVDTPAYTNYPGEGGQVRYGEGIFIGYRYYDFKEVPVLFPFGYGLSYTTFKYSKPKVSAVVFKDVEGLTVSVDVTNTGQMAGKEIVQVYVHDQQARLMRPVKELKGFAKVALEAGQTKTVTIALDFRAFAYYHPAYQQWSTEDGEYDILIGASAADVRARLTVNLKSTLTLPCLLNRDSTIREWLEDPRGEAVLRPMMEMAMAQMSQAMGVGQEGGLDMGMEFMMDTPLLVILNFMEAMLPTPPEEIVATLLDQVKGKA
jgi:beta-glucosidase